MYFHWLKLSIFYSWSKYKPPNENKRGVSGNLNLCLALVLDKCVQKHPTITGKS